MSIETLKEDLKQNMASLAALNPDMLAADPALAIKELIGHLKDTLWPTLEALVDEVDEIDESVAEMVENSVDILHPDTAAIFSAVIAGAATVAAALRIRLEPAKDAQLLKVVTELEKNLKEATEIMKEIVIDDGSPLDPEEDDEDGDEEDDGDENDDDDQEGTR